MNEDDFKKKLDNEPMEPDIQAVLSKISDFEDVCSEQDINDVRKQLKALGVGKPDIIMRRLEMILGVKRKSKFAVQRIVAGFLIFVFFISVVLIVDRENVTAFRRMFYGIFSTQTEHSEDIRSLEISLPKYIPPIPNGFEIKESKTNDNTAIYKFENREEQFLTITIYAEGYSLSIDNEKLDSYEEVVINGYSAKKFLKKDVTLFVIFYGQQLVTIASNLPESQVSDFADGIKPQEEGGSE